MHAQTAQHVAALSSDAASAVVSSVSPDANAQQQCAADESSMQQVLLPKPASSAYKHPISVARRHYTVVLVALIAALLSADQNLLAPNMSAAAAYFGLDDAQKDTYLGGYLMAAFFLVGAPAALLCGYFSDRLNRVYLLAFIVVVGEAPCLCTYWVTELWQFFIVRMLTGISIGGCFPLVFSLLGDLFPVSRRAAMSAIVQIAVGGGIGGGQMVAGLVGPATNWRVPFVVMATPTLLLAVLLVLTVKEPPRGGFEKALEGQLAVGATYSEAITLRKVWQLLRVNSNWLIIFQGIFGCLPWGVIQTYITDYLHVQKGLSIEMATTVIMMFGVGCAAGVVAGGAAGQALYNRRRWTMAVLTGVSVIAGAAPILFLINADIQAMGLVPALLMAALAGFLSSIPGPSVRAIMLNVNTPETRGVALALQSVTDDLGKGLGPVIVAAFISRLGRTGAFNLSVSAWVPCGIMLTSLACTMGRDEDTMQERLAEQSAQTLRRILVIHDSSASPQPPEPPGSPSGDQPPESGGNNSSSAAARGAGFEPASYCGHGNSGSGSTRGFDAGGGGKGHSSSRGFSSRGFDAGGGSGVAGFKLLSPHGAAADASCAGGSSTVMIPVLAEAGGSVEMQQLLAHVHGVEGSSSWVHQQQHQQQHHTLHTQPQYFEQHQHRLQQPQPQQQSPEDCVLGITTVPQAAQQRPASTPLLDSSSSSRSELVHLQRSYSPGACLAPAASLAVSAAGARHRAKQREAGAGGGYSSDSGGSSCGRALGEGVEDSYHLAGVAAGGSWQPYHGLLHTHKQQGLVA